MNNEYQYSFKVLGSCIGCKTCYRACPVGAIQTGPIRIDQDACIRCGKCEAACPGHKIIKA